MTCQCEVCRAVAETKRLLEGASPELTAHVWKLWERIEAAETDAEWLRMKMKEKDRAPDCG